MQNINLRLITKSGVSLNRYISLLNAELKRANAIVELVKVLIDTYRCLMQNLATSALFQSSLSLNRYISLLNAEHNTVQELDLIQES